MSSPLFPLRANGSGPLATLRPLSRPARLWAAVLAIACAANSSRKNRSRSSLPLGRAIFTLPLSLP